MAKGRTSSQVPQFPTPVPPELLVVQRPDPSDEAARLAAPGVLIFSTAAEVRALHQTVGGRDRVPRSPAARAAARRRAEADAAERSEEAAEGTTEAPVAAEEVPPAATPDEIERERDAQILRLQRAAYQEDSLAFEAALTQQQSLQARTERLRSLATQVGVGAAFAVAAVGALTSAVVGVVLLVVAVLAAAAAVLHYRRLDHELGLLEVEVDRSYQRMRSYPPAATAYNRQAAPESWSAVLAELGLPPAPPSQLAEVVARVRLRDVRPPVPAARPPRSGPPVPATAPTDPPAGTLPHLVVVVDDGLYVGHRIALRDSSEKLAAMVPVLVLTTNERLWQTPSRTR